MIRDSRLAAVSLSVLLFIGSAGLTGAGSWATASPAWAGRHKLFQFSYPLIDVRISHIGRP